MKSIYKILLAVLCIAPIGANAAPVAQTAGSNLTQYNGSMGSVVGNQWNNASNPRANANDKTTTAKADYGNCESVILRCAKPKCAGGGCIDITVAQPIVAGCLNSNTTCKKYSKELMEPLVGQLQAAAVAAQNQQNANAAAATAAAEQNAAIMQQQMQAMQDQMQQMQAQNSAQIASLQNALTESQNATANAVAAAAESAAANVITNTSTVVDAGTGLTAAQTAAAKSGVDPETIMRAQISGQIMTGLQGVDESLKQLKSTMTDAFKYGGCNTINGDNCTGPKRIKKFRELAQKFFEPYDALGKNLEMALLKARSVGVDLGNIYMFFSGSCNRWAEYVCRNPGTLQTECVGKSTTTKTSFSGVTSEKTVCEEGTIEKYVWPTYTKDTCSDNKSQPNKPQGIRGGYECAENQIIPPEDLTYCTINKILDPADSEFSSSVLNPDSTSDASIRVGCARDEISMIIPRRTNGASGKGGGIDIDLLQWIIAQEGGDKPDNAKLYCGLGIKGKSDPSTDQPQQAINRLKAATISKALTGGTNTGACCSNAGDTCTTDCYDLSKDVSYVAPVYALCDTHAYNIEESTNDITDEEKKEQLKEVIALKTTVIAQQMYRSYSSIDKIISQLKVMLEKETLKASLNVAGGTSDNDDDSGDTTEFENCNNKGEDSAVLSCLRSNLAVYEPYVTKGNAKNNITKQMRQDMRLLTNFVDDKTKFDSRVCGNNGTMTKNTLQNCYDELQRGIRALDKQIKDEQKPKTYQIEVKN